jgi:hypothetical protein
MGQRIKRGELSRRTGVGGSCLKPLSSNLRRPPAEEIEREMAADGLKISLITGDKRCTDAARGQRDQDIERKLANFCGVIMLTFPHITQNVGSRHPVGLRRSEHLAALSQVHHKSTFKPRPCATKQLMHHDSRAANHVGSLEKMKGKPTSSEVIDIDRGVQNGELSWP